MDDLLTALTLLALLLLLLGSGLWVAVSLVGVGFRAQASGDKVSLSLGFSHPVVHVLPKGVKAETPVQTDIVIKGMKKLLE